MQTIRILTWRIMLVSAVIGFIFIGALLLIAPKGAQPLVVGQMRKKPTVLVGHVDALTHDVDARVGLPMRLRIPKINVNAAIEHVALTADGAMNMPKDFADVAWYAPGPRPGENGNAVIDGHFGKKNGKASVFDNLHQLQKGNKIYVEDDKGVITTFVVRESRVYDPAADVAEVFIATDGQAHLNLITCEGVWDPVSKSYSKRLVIFADKE